MKFGTGHIKKLTAENILNEITEWQIFKYYISALDSPNMPFCSEIRKDNNPTCRVSLLNKGWVYKDFGNGDTYNCFTYVQEKYGLKFIEALKVINSDFGLRLGDDTSNKSIPKVAKEILTGEDVKPTDIRIVSKKWDSEGLNYWKQYNINQDILDRYHVKQLEGYYLNDKYFNKSGLTFAYCFGQHRYKILRPNDSFKWLSNAGGVVQGINQLKPGGLLFITSSLKDVMTLVSLGYKAVAPQSENTLISQGTINKFKAHFTEVILYLNNDAPGIAASLEQSEKYGMHYIVNPAGEPKDPSDYVKRYNADSLKQLLKHYGF